MKFFDQIQLDHLKGDQYEIAEIIGIENYKKMVLHFGGDSVYIQKKDTIVKEIRAQHIAREFTGYNYRELALKYNLAERTIREIVSKNMSMEDVLTKKGQLSIYDLT